MALAFAHTLQRFQDWFTQQWIIVFGKRLDLTKDAWLVGPIGKVGDIGDSFIHDLAQKDGLQVRRNAAQGGLLNSIHQLQLSPDEVRRLTPEVIDFYENTAEYKLQLTIQWNRIFKWFGKGVTLFFSQRIQQLQIPTQLQAENELSSEIIQLVDEKTEQVVYTIWYRTLVQTQTVLYAGIYGVTTLPSGITCVKAVFPLPNGNATVLLQPKVGASGDFFLQSKGHQFGDPGFYFLVKDQSKQWWSQFHAAFTDELRVFVEDGRLQAKQELKLWGWQVAVFSYALSKQSKESQG